MELNDNNTNNTQHAIIIVTSAPKSYDLDIKF